MVLCVVVRLWRHIRLCRLCLGIGRLRMWPPVHAKVSVTASFRIWVWLVRPE